MTPDVELDAGSVYRALAQIVFYVAALAAVVGSLVGGDWGWPRLRANLRGRWGAGAAVVFAVQIAASVGVLAAPVSDLLRNVVLANWLLVVLAGLVLPWGVRMDGEDSAANDPPRWSWKWVAGTTMLLWMVSFGWFAAISPFVDVEPNPILEQLPLDAWFWILFPPLALATGAAEEIIFRGGIQPALARRLGGGSRAEWGAAVAAAIVFALGHAAYADTPLVKEVQIVMVGVGFGVLRMRCGLGAAVASHMVFNLGVVGLSMLGFLVSQP